MHVLIIPSEHFVTSIYPLGGIFQLHQAVALHQMGYRVGVISPGVISPRFLLKRYDYPKFEESHGFPIYRHYLQRLRPQRWMEVSQGILFFQKMGLDLYYLYKKRFGKPDVIHAHNIKYAGFIAQMIKDTDNVPYVITEHSSEFMTQDMPVAWYAAMRTSMQGASVMTAVSHALKRSINQQLDARHVEVLPNIVESSLMTCPMKKCSGAEFVFLNVAGLDANKNHAFLIEAFARSFRGKQASLRIGGSGPLHRYLKRLTKKLQVEDQVIFLGFLDRQTLIREMQAANCFVLSSLRETFGVVLVEALASGTPIISTRCGGADDIVTEENGLLVDVGNVVALSAAMIQMVSSKGEYHPASLRDTCKARYGAEAFSSQVNRFYTQAMGLR